MFRNATYRRFLAIPILGLALASVAATCINGGTLNVSIDPFGDGLAVDTVASAVCAGRGYDLVSGARRDFPAQTAVAKKVRWDNPAAGSDHPAVVTVVCRRGAEAGWEATAVQTDEFARLEATAGDGGSYVLTSKSRGHGITCSGAIYDLNFKRLAKLGARTVGPKHPASWTVDSRGITGFGIVTCRVAGLVDADVLCSRTMRSRRPARTPRLGRRRCRLGDKCTWRSVTSTKRRSARRGRAGRQQLKARQPAALSHTSARG
mgnify:CR=1 FL=1